MFERNRIDNAPEATTVPVDVSFTNGEQIAGKLIVPRGRSPLELLNGPDAFIAFEPYGGEHQYLAKSQIAAMRPTGVPRNPTLNLLRGGHDEFDPHAILGVPRDCSRDEIRQAYVRLSKTYHPDLYSSAILPDEVKSYLETMARRLNAAYAALEQTQHATKPTPMPRFEPIFTSAPRG